MRSLYWLTTFAGLSAASSACDIAGGSVPEGVANGEGGSRAVRATTVSASKSNNGSTGLSTAETAADASAATVTVGGDPIPVFESQ